MAEVKKLNISRGAVQHRVTNIKKFLENNEEVDIDIEELRHRQDLLETSFKEYNLFHDLLLNVIEEDDEATMEAAIEKGDLFHDLYFEVKLLLAKAMVKTIKRPTQAPATDIITTEGGHRAVKLPTIILPTFDGAYEKWLNFHDTFSSLIHNSTSLSTIEKFHYLKSTLSGGALNLIESIDVTNENYEVAWLLLKERFENKKMLIKRHVNALFELKMVPKENSANLRMLLDAMTMNLRVLKQLGEPVDQWGTMIVFFVSNKFDNSTRKEWETSSYGNKKDVASVSDLTEFLRTRCAILESLESHSSNQSTSSSVPSKSQPKWSTSSGQKSNSFVSSVTSRIQTPSSVSSTEVKCGICGNNHFAHLCPDFLKLSVSERHQKVVELRMCFNCLRAGHSSLECTSIHRCKQCNKRHHSLIHFSEGISNKNCVKMPGSSGVLQTSMTNKNDVQPSINLCSRNQSGKSMLATAIVNVKNHQGEQVKCRVLLDSASESNFISEELCQRLKLKRNRVFIPISGISDTQTDSPVKHSVDATIGSTNNGFKVNMEFLIMSKITGGLPSRSVDISSWDIPKNVVMADPWFNIKSKIDMLVGAQMFFRMMSVGQIDLSENLPMLQKTVFGWIVCGTVMDTCKNNSSSISLLTTEGESSVQSYTNFCNQQFVPSSLEKDIVKFWEMEEVTSPSLLTKEEQSCEDFFKSTVRRDVDGKFVVKLPIRDNLDKLGDSYNSALKRFHLLEKRFDRQPDLRQHYNSFINEYYNLNHMREVTEDTSIQLPYYMPHHPVIKPSSTTTKVRVVFDASMKTSSGSSLNDVLMVGPTVQSDLLSIMLRFRLQKYVMIADIAKMYRQINVDLSDVHLQRILWRSSPQEDVKSYELTTVTYGTASAPYLATRCLNQVSIDIKESHPTESKIIEKDVYVDDLITGVKDVESGEQIQRNLMNILDQYGFELRKWCSNSSDILENLPEELRETNSTFNIDNDDTIKTLGLLYQPKSDKFRYIIQDFNEDQRITKRNILSEIAKIFDPLGLVGPVITVAKVFMQVLWQLKLNWDESLPLLEHTKWLKFRTQLVKLNELEINRWVLPVDKSSEIQIHGFCDASQVAFGACVYLRVTNEIGEHHVNLLSSKGRVCPLKTVSIPRLELCGAVLLTKLVNSVMKSLDIKIDKCFFWTDSTIVLAWLQKSPSSLKTFVANRVTEAQKLSSCGSWNHVLTKDNPADLISRGCSPESLIQSELWWSGPKWLSEDMPIQSELSLQSTLESFSKDDLEEKLPIISLVTVEDNNFNMLHKFSSYKKLQRITAYCLRFIDVVVTKRKPANVELSVKELQKSSEALIRLSQNLYFKKDIQELSKNGQVCNSSKLLKLTPFLDEAQLVRVGGRLKHSLLTEGQKHPIVLSNSCNLTKLIFEDYHRVNLHAGPQALLASVRQKYWPINGKSSARKTVHECIRCFKTKPQSLSHIMGELPQDRVQPVLRPFMNTGVDYCGPVMIKRAGRSQIKDKAYVALFVCFATKAIHLELVGDLTTVSFIAALKRFIGRRGKCLNLYSDNATNFVGANKELQDLREQFLSKSFEQDVQRALAAENITWHFIPPRSPHFGGLWEAGVKSAKSHLKRVLGSSSLTFEEYNTVLIQVEAVLNSRPLTSLTSDPNDLRVLTPGHFLIGDSLTSTAEPSLQDIQLNKLSRWQRVQKMQHDFWIRWSNEYLPELQEKVKWKTQHQNIQLGTLVLIKEDNLPPLQWSVGRIKELHPGTDNVVRVVTVKTATGLFKRAIQRICPFPTSGEIEGKTSI